MTVRCHACRQTFQLTRDDAHRHKSHWQRDGTRRTILCPACAARWPQHDPTRSNK